MTRILEVINRPGSAQNFIGEQFTVFHERGGYEMHLICSPGNGIEQWCAERGVHYFPVRLERRTRPLSDLKALWQIVKYIRRSNIDIIICHQEKARLLGTLAAWLLRVPLRIIYAHGVIVDTMRGAKKRFFVLEGRMVSAMCHRVVCVSPSVMRRRIEEGMDNPSKQVLIGHGTCNGIDTKCRFNPQLIAAEETDDLRTKLGLSPDDFVVGFVGRIVRDKGIIELAEGFRLLTERHPERTIKLLIIGRIEKSDSVPQATLDYLASSPNVIFTGLLPHAEMPKYYLPMNVVVLPSYREGFGLVTAEAGAMGVPAIVSRSTGCIDSIVEGQTGLFTDIEPHDIADKIERFFDMDYAHEMGQRARQHVVENFDQAMVIGKTLEFINQASEQYLHK